MIRALGVLLSAGAAILSTGSEAAPAGQQGQAEVVRVELSNFRLNPGTLSLVHGHAYVLELVNRSSGGHDFTARGLFASARIESGDGARIEKGSIEVPGKETVRIGFVPLEPGTFEFHCAHPFHATLGMKGRMVVQ
jgi:uncharacterized cupredoxin-like copper-binding protein